MSKKIAKYEDNPEFLEFLNEQFNDVAANATTDELAEFSFGSIGEAVKAFEETVAK